MTSATKQKGKMKSSNRSPLAASPQPIGLPAGMWERICGKIEGIETDTISRTGSTPRPS